MSQQLKALGALSGGPVQFPTPTKYLKTLQNSSSMESRCGNPVSQLTCRGTNAFGV